MNHLTFAQLVDLDQIHRLLESHYKITGLVAGILDTNENIMIAVGYHDICTRFHFTHPVTKSRCRESDASIKAHLHERRGGYMDYRCQNGLVDVAMPIFINDAHLATFFTGQFFYEDEKPDVEFFRRQAREFGFDESGYLECLARVPIFSRDYIHSVIDFYRNLVDVITAMGLKNLELKQEIAGHKRAEEELLLTKFCVDNASIAICRVSPDGQILDANRHLCSSLGYTHEELVTKHIADINPILTREKWPEHMHMGKETGCFTFETMHLRRDGTVFPVEVTVSLLKFGNEEVRFSFVQDISERKRMETELRQAHDELEKKVIERTEQLAKTNENLRISEERYALAVKGSNDALWDLNLITGAVYRSPRWGNIIGHETDELAGDIKEWSSRIHQDDYQRVMNAFDIYIKGETPLFESEYRLRHRDGGYRWVLSRGACLRDDMGKPYRIAGSLTDITEKKKLEQQLFQSQKMESIGVLAGGVAHEFNNLLMAISGYSQMLQESITPDDELSRENLAHILSATERAAALTRGLLAFSRRQVINPKPARLDALITNVRQLIQRIIGEDIEITTALSGNNPLVKADAGQFEQVMMNLSANARDAMPRGGRISIATSRVTIENGTEADYELPSPGNYARISFSDTGKGIDRALLGKIFEPFYTTKEVGKGTGLGLSIVHGIIKQHNGAIVVDSEPGKGTTFDIYLPLCPEMESIRTDVTIATPRTGHMETILVVEDDENVRTCLKIILEKAGYSVRTAGDGQEAVEIFDQCGDITLVLTDVIMPRKNGMEMLNEIRAAKPGIKAIFISGYTADCIREKGCLESEAVFITKPFKKEDLLRTLREVLDEN